MGIDQWSRRTIISGSYFHHKYKIRPGECLVMYNTSTGMLIFKDNQGKVIYQEYVDSVEGLAATLVSDIPNNTDIQAFGRLVRGGKSRGGKGTKLEDHHIIPVHLWKDCQIVVVAEGYNLIEWNSPQNMMLLPEEFHREHHLKHSKYSQKLRSILKDSWNIILEDHRDSHPPTIRDALISIIEMTRETLEYLVESDGSINDI